MACGTVELSVPLRDGVIQIGAGGQADVGRIRVSKKRRAITVFRVDGRPMQVDIVADAQSSTRVFAVPVRVLRLARSESRWSVVGKLVGAHRLSDVKRFADVVGTFAVAKQARAQQAHRG
ncbi:hypothetical protein JCM12141A_58130 [Mycolicibacterium hodleri]